MLITNHHHIEAPIEAPDDSLAIAAEAEYIRGAIGEARLQFGPRQRRGLRALRDDAHAQQTPSAHHGKLHHRRRPFDRRSPPVRLRLTPP